MWRAHNIDKRTSQIGFFYNIYFYKFIYICTFLYLYANKNNYIIKYIIKHSITT